MGMKMNALVIKGRPNCTSLELVQSLGFENAKWIEDSVVEVYIFPDNNILTVAYWDDYTVLTNSELAWYLIEPELTSTSFRVDNALKHFQKQDALAIYLQSTVNGYGFSLVEEGRVKRSIIGQYEIEPMERGPRTLIEEKYHKMAEVINGELIFNYEGEQYTHDAIGESIVLDQLEDFTGKGSGEIHELKTEVFSLN
jgi:hypothetical protein